MPHSPLQLLVSFPCQTWAFYEGVQCPEETAIHPCGEGKIKYRMGWDLSACCCHWHTADCRLGQPHLDSSSLSISKYFLFWAFPGAASISFFIWAMRIFWKSSCVKTRLVLMAAALAFRSSMGMLSSFVALKSIQPKGELTTSLSDRQLKSFKF